MERPQRAFLIGALAYASAGPLAAQEVGDVSYVATDGDAVAGRSIVVPAPVPEVWAAFTTTEGVITWAAPFADVDFRVGIGRRYIRRASGEVGEASSSRACSHSSARGGRAQQRTRGWTP